MNRMSQGKGRGSKVKMVYKENERKIAKKKGKKKKKKEKKKPKNNGEMEQWQKEGEEKNAQSLTFGPLCYFHHHP